MKKLLFILFLLSGKIHSQNINLHLPIEHTKFVCAKLSLRTNVNRDKLNDILNNNMDGITFSSLVSYNLRFRININKNFKIYVGDETINTNFNNKYIGFIKKFPVRRNKIIINPLD